MLIGRLRIVPGDGRVKACSFRSKGKRRNAIRPDDRNQAEMPQFLFFASGGCAEACVGSGEC